MAIPRSVRVVHVAATRSVNLRAPDHARNWTLVQVRGPELAIEIHAACSAIRAASRSNERAATMKHTAAATHIDGARAIATCRP